MQSPQKVKVTLERTVGTVGKTSTQGVYKDKCFRSMQPAEENLKSQQQVTHHRYLSICSTGGRVSEKRDHMDTVWKRLL